MTHHGQPGFKLHEVLNIINEQYNLQGEIQLLDSYIDQNFLLETSEKEKFVFKIANRTDSLDFLKATQEVMTILSSDNEKAACPKIINNIHKDKIVHLLDSNKDTYFAWMISFIPGKLFAKVENHSDELLSNLGSFIGNLDSTLQNYFNPSFHKYLDWDLRNALDAEPFLSYIPNASDKNIAAYFLNLFRTFVIPNFSKLRMSVIHNDPNDYNLFVTEDQKNISGIIDFGDMVHSYTVNNLAIAISYAVFGKEDILEKASIILNGYHKVYPLTEIEVEMLYYLIGARMAVTVCMAAHKASLNPKNDYFQISAQPAWDALRKMVKINPDYASHKFKETIDPKGKQNRKQRTKEELIELRKKNLSQSLSVSYNTPLKINRGFMQYLYEEDESAYLDTVNNVCHVGHAHPDVVKAGQNQMAILNTNTRYLHETIIEYAQELLATFPDKLEVAFFVNSGSEANELAIRMARTFTKSKEIAVLDHAYHGNTNGNIEISPYKFNGKGGNGAAEHVHVIPLADTYRGKYKASDPDAALKYAQELNPLISNLKNKGEKLGTFIAESIPGVAGQIIFPDGFLKEAYHIIRAQGGVCIADEVQIGFGRTGTGMWGFELQNVCPDIVTMGKPIGNGHPLGAVVTTREIAEAFHNGMEYFNTFGGNPVSCAIGLEVLRVIKKDKLKENALETGKYFLKLLKDLKTKHEIIGDVRGIGLFLGIEFVKNRKTLEPAAEEASLISNLMKENHILTSVDGPLFNVIKIKPPIVFNKENALQYVETLDRILESL